MDKKAEIIVKDGEVYELRMVISKPSLEDLIRDHHYRENIGMYVSQEFAKKFVDAKFDELSKLIDFETVKVLATRAITRTVIGNGQVS